MEQKSNCRIVPADRQLENWVQYLYLLYYPLMEKDACMLYCLLQAQAPYASSMEDLIKASLLSKSRFETARKCLEQFWLLKTYYDPLHESWLLELLPVLDPRAFLTNETYSRLYMNEMGSPAFERLKKQLLPEENKSAFQEISAAFDATRLEKSWSAAKERTYERLKPKTLEENPWNYDFDALFAGYDRVFPLVLRTKENKEIIGRLGSIHGISIEQMRTYLSRATNPNTLTFSPAILESLVLHSKKSTAADGDLYALSPVQFLMRRQNGAPVSEGDKRLLEKLVTDYQFPFDVVNLLVEYCLNNTNQHFSAAYVEKVAGTWARLKVDSREKAREAMKPEKTAPRRIVKKENIQDLPQWYSNTAATQPEEDLLRQIEAQKKLLQKKGDER